MVLMASWQMVGSAMVAGLIGLGLKIGGRPMPEMMRSAVRLEEGGARVWETLFRS